MANELNQYSSITNGQAVTPTYDLDGNLLTQGGDHYTWNGENRLTSFSNDTVQVSYVYDYMGRRAGKTVTEWDETAQAWVEASSSTYIYDGWNLIAEVTTRDEQTDTDYYTWGKDLSGSMQGAGGIGGLVSSTSGENVLYHAYDANGNLTQSVDDSGAIRADYRYDAFGNTLSAEGDLADDNPFRFSTKYHDDETGLVYYGFRYYNPQIGRWVNRDPIGEWGGLNLHRFVGNDPVRGFDILGLSGTMSCDEFTTFIRNQDNWPADLRARLRHARDECGLRGSLQTPCECCSASNIPGMRRGGYFDSNHPRRITFCEGSQSVEDWMVVLRHEFSHLFDSACGASWGCLPWPSARFSTLVCTELRAYQEINVGDRAEIIDRMVNSVASTCSYGFDHANSWTVWEIRARHTADLIADQCLRLAPFDPLPELPPIPIPTPQL